MKKILMMMVLVFASVPQAWGDALSDHFVTNTTIPFGGTGIVNSGKGLSNFNGPPGSNTKSSPASCLTNATGCTGGGSLADADCLNAQTKVNTICIGNNNPGIQKAATLITSIGSAGLSMTDACSKFNDALKTANDAVIAYNAACSAAGYYCRSTCLAAKARHATDDQYEIANADEDVSQACTANMKTNLMDAGIGLAGMAAASSLGKQCENKTTDTSVACTTQTAANGSATNPLCINGVDCSQAANASNPTCICNLNPNTPGCPGATSYGGSGTPSSNYGTTATNTTSGTSSTTSGTPSTGLSAVTRNTTNPSSADGATAGGGGGYGGAVSGDSIAASADVKKGQTADKKGSLNTNILSDYDGGGGGARGSGGGGSGGGSGYNAYMPGQRKDPSRALASQNAISSQVTSAGSKSNWEKVTERYTENKPTLMGD